METINIENDGEEIPQYNQYLSLFHYASSTASAIMTGTIGAAAILAFQKLYNFSPVGTIVASSLTFVFFAQKYVNNAENEDEENQLRND